MELHRTLAVARGDEPADLLLRNVRIVTCTDDACTVTPPAFVAIFGGLIAGLGPMTHLDPGAPVLREIGFPHRPVLEIIDQQPDVSIEQSARALAAHGWVKA